jgi:hypothetical protein
MMFLDFLHKHISKIAGVDMGPKLSKRLDSAFSKVSDSIPLLGRIEYGKRPGT